MEMFYSIKKIQLKFLCLCMYSIKICKFGVCTISLISKNHAERSPSFKFVLQYRKYLHTNVHVHLPFIIECHDFIIYMDRKFANTLNNGLGD